MNKENKLNKEISNKKAIIVLIVTGILLIILGAIYATIFNNKEIDKCNNIIIQNNNREREGETVRPRRNH